MIIKSFKDLRTAFFLDFKTYGANSLKSKIITFFLNPAFRLIFNHRLSQFCRSKKIPFFPGYLSYKQKTKYASEISLNASIGNNVRFAHPFGIVIGGNTIIEDNVIIYHQVTFGSHGKSGIEKSYPTIMSNSIIYAGAKIIGGITIFENCVIGANSVVNKDIPANNLAYGIPAKIHLKNE